MLSEGVYLSCLPVSHFAELDAGTLTLADIAKKFKELGTDAMDIGIRNLKGHMPNYLRDLKKELDEIGMPIFMCCSYPDFTNPDPMQRRRELDYLRGDIAVCSALGVQTVRVLAGQNHPIDQEDGVKWAVENLLEANETAKAYGITLLLEDHGKPLIWDYEDFTFNPENFLAIVKELHGSGIKLNFDTGNLASFGVDPLPVMQEVMDDIMTIHVLDTATFGKFTPCVTGTGIVDFPQIFRELKKRGFQGWLCIEELSGTGWDGVEKAVEYVRKTWEKA